LAVRALLQRDGQAAGIRWLVTLGTPHGGTRALPWLRLGPFRCDVRPGSHALHALGSTRLPAGAEAVAIASPDDAVLVPPGRARWSAACTAAVQGGGRLGLLGSARRSELIVETLPENLPEGLARRLDETSAAGAAAAVSGRGE